MGKYHLISIAILLIAIQFNFTSLVAQELERVEIRMKDGSVMKGLIPFKSELRNLSDFNFYKNRNVDPIKINPTGIDSLKINNFSFVCAEISVESSSNRKKELSNKKDPIMRTDHAFLLPIVTGPKSLYYYKDKEGKEHFVFKNGEK